MMKHLCALIEKEKIKYIKIDGSTNSLARKTLVDEFQTGDQIRVAILSITAANTGLTLTSAQLVVFAELFWYVQINLSVIFYFIRLNYILKPGLLSLKRWVYANRYISK